jgi:hypothetical protein
MARSLFAAAALSAALLVGCGGNKMEAEPEIRSMLRDFAIAVVTKNDDRINMYILPTAGQYGSPVGAKQLDTPEGKAVVVEGNRRWARSTFKEAGILEEKDIDSFMQATKLFISDAKNAEAKFEIAAQGRRVAEIVTFRLTKTDQGWRVHDYSRDIKGR